MNFAVISHMYPVGNSTKYVFVEQLLKAFVRQGHKCTVIAPYNTYLGKKGHFPPEYEVKPVDSTNSIVVYRPRFFVRNIPIVPVSTAYYMASRAFEKVIVSNGLRFDFIYSHFFIPATFAWHYVHNHNIPLFVATGESVIKTRIQKPRFSFSWKKFRKDTMGVICVSKKNYDECVGLGYADKSKCGVFPNAIDKSLFRKLDKVACRKRLGIDKNVFVIAFVGWFNERKGSVRVAKSVDLLNDDNVFSLFVGQKQKVSDIEPLCRNILFKGAVAHDDVPIYLNAADVFVLPTLSEGCCNAIVEAMACGLPIISSDLPFNYDVLDESNSIMVDPNDIYAIGNAISKLKSDSVLRKNLSEGALRTSEKLTIDARASAIMNFVESKIYGLSH